jgi:hypothetical protein
VKRIWIVAALAAIAVLVIALARRSDGPVAVSGAKGPTPRTATPVRPALGKQLDIKATAAATGKANFKAGWGSNAGQVGARAANESNPEGPMALVATKDGVMVLDQVNGRVIKFGPDGKPLKEFPIGPDTAQDMAVDDKGRVAVLDRIHEGQVLMYDENGTLIGQVPVVGGALNEAGGATGVFIDETGVYVEREHTETVQVMGPGGLPLDNRPTLPGRPFRDGTGSAQASIGDRAAGIVKVLTFNAQADFIWQRPIRFPAPIISIVLLDTDRQGRIFLGVHIANESPDPPHDLIDERIIVVGLAQADGSDKGSVVLPPPAEADESLRPLSIDDDGVIYQMLPSASGIEVLTYTLP